MDNKVFLDKKISGTGQDLLAYMILVTPRGEVQYSQYTRVNNVSSCRVNGSEADWMKLPQFYDNWGLDFFDGWIDGDNLHSDKEIMDKDFVRAFMIANKYAHETRKKAVIYPWDM